MTKNVNNNNGDFDPLVKPRNTNIATSSNRCKWLIPFVAGMLVAGAVFIVDGLRAEQSNPFKVLFKSCEAICHTRQQQRIDKYGGNLLDRNDMVRLLTAAREKAIQRLQVDYGEKYFSDIFQEQHNGTFAIRKALVPPSESGLSTERLRRKLQMKLLQVQTTMQAQERNLDGCDCVEAEAAADKQNQLGEKPPKKAEGARFRFRRRLETTTTATPSDSTNISTTLPPLEDSFAKFIWTTGGHSAAAGHGNLYNESYTAFMERLAKDVFAAAGIEFVGKNYAMGGMKSASEIALCAEAIFGSDTDAVSWDFGMTDGGSMPWTYRMFLYNGRVGLLPSRPVLFGIHVDMGDQKGVYSFFESNGLAAFMLDPAAEKIMTDGVPDCLGLPNEQLLALPSYVRNFKCDGKLENGDPFCGIEKYNDAICEKRQFKAGWHPGWKAHALTGNAMALFLIESLLEAAQDLASKTGDAAQLLEELKTKEDADYQQFLDFKLPENLWGAYNTEEYGDTKVLFAEVKPDVYYKSPAICHTGLLPAETRFQGFVTESDKKGFWDYDIGVTKELVESNPSIEKDKSLMRLAYTKESRQDCPVPLNADYKDYFYTARADGWTTLTVPNDAEAKAYRYDSSKVHGLVIIRLGYGEWGNHEEGDLQVKDINEGKASLEVNGIPVQELINFAGTYILKGPDGLKWKPNNEGKFVLRAKVNIDKAYLRLSSVIIL